MNRRHLIAVCTLATVGLLALADEPKKDAHHGHAAHFMECAKACDDCARMCDACGAHCVQMVADGKKEHLETVKTCQDCATFCSAASCITARGGVFSDLICKACADACKRCGDACAKHKGDEMMAKCAEECRKCEKACRDMLKHVGHDHHEAK